MRALISVLAALALPVGSALACSCIEAIPSREVVPRDGATGFPVDGRVRIFLSAFPPALRARLADEYRLRGPEGLVPLQATVVATRLDLAATLKPRTTYTLEQVFAYDAHGQRLSDSERFATLRGRPAAQRLWYAVSRFTTGDARAVAPPAQPTVERVNVGYRHGGGDCGPGTSLYARFQVPAAGPFDVLELEVDGHGVVATAPAAGLTDLGVSDLLCNPDPYSLGKGPQRARVAAVGAGPARPKPAPWTDGPQAASSLFGRAARPRTPLPPATFDPWFTPAAGEAPPVEAAGPARCPHGLTRAWSAVADAAWGPTDYGAWIGLGGTADGAWLAAEPGEQARLVRVGPGGVTTTPLDESVEASDFTDDSATLLLRHRDDQVVRLTATSLAADGKARWATPLTTEHLNWHGRVARCGDRVLVAYTQVIGQAYGDARLHWALLDAADGRVVRRTTLADAPVQGFGEGSGVGCHGDGFLLVLGVPRGAAAWRIDAAGVATASPAPPGTTWSIARDGAGSVVASSTREGVRVAFLDAAGAETRVVLAARGHQQRKPVIAAGPDDLFGLSWEAWPGDTAHATVLDRTGRVAEPLALGAGAHRRTAAIAGAPGGFVAAAVVEPGTEVEGLVCAPAPRGGAPARLAP